MVTRTVASVDYVCMTVNTETRQVEDLTVSSGGAAEGHIDAALSNFVKHGGVITQCAGIVRLDGQGTIGILVDLLAELGQQLSGGVILGIVAVNLQFHRLGFRFGSAGGFFGAAASHQTQDHNAGQEQSEQSLHDNFFLSSFCRSSPVYHHKEIKHQRNIISIIQEYIDFVNNSLV